MILKKGTIFLFAFQLQQVFAHGMNALGPHGGYIQMPGTFHTELVDKGNEMHVYLLDLTFKNPMTADSSVLIKYSGKDIKQLDCSKEVDHFVCDKPMSSIKGIKEISLTPVRNKIKGKEAIYPLPLKLEK